ncbi:hypothetical protein SRHO_G00143890 [Serrasalmus rhombeus]
MKFSQRRIGLGCDVIMRPRPIITALILVVVVYFAAAADQKVNRAERLSDAPTESFEPLQRNHLKFRTSRFERDT